MTAPGLLIVIVIVLLIGDDLREEYPQDQSQDSIKRTITMTIKKSSFGPHHP